jgi:hypothetical protein
MDSSVLKPRRHFQLLVVPRRPHNRRPGYWLRAFVSLVVVAVLVAAGLVGYYDPSRWGCYQDWRPLSTVWQQGDECVGTTDGPYAFEPASYKTVLDVIRRQNEEAGKTVCHGPRHGEPVTIGVLLTLTARNAVGRALHQLEGYAATQAAVNRAPDCVRPVKLRVGQIGKAPYEAADEVARTLAGSPVVAMVGMGLSDVMMAKAANAVAGSKIPMVADLITAEGFDANGSKADNPDFTDCKDAVNGTESYANGGGVGDGWFFRVGYRNTVQVTQLSRYGKPTADESDAATTADFLLKPFETADPATCTQLPEYRARFTPAHEFSYDTEQPQTLTDVVHAICRSTGDVVVVYGARAVDASQFLTDLDRYYDQEQRGTCLPSRITILEGSDASRLRAAEPDPDRDRMRLEALGSPSFRSGKVRLLFTPLANPDLPQTATSPDYVAFRDTFTGLRFPEDHLDDGWALNAHDALTTVSAALQKIAPADLVDGRRVRSMIETSYQLDEVEGAIQDGLRFDVAGNTVGVPQVVRLCPLVGGSNRTVTVPVEPGEPGICPGDPPSAAR